LIKSAEFYEDRNPTLGEAFVSTVEATLPKLQRHPELGKPAGLGRAVGKRNAFRSELFIWNSHADFGLSPSRI
jgi:plasmid stabilization system protein ParE